MAKVKEFGKTKIIENDTSFVIEVNSVSLFEINKTTGVITNVLAGTLFTGNTQFVSSGGNFQILAGTNTLITASEVMPEATIAGQITIDGSLGVNNTAQVTGDLTVLNGNINNSGESGGAVNTNELYAGTVHSGVLEADEIKGRDRSNCGQVTLDISGTVTVTTSQVTSNSIILISPAQLIYGSLYEWNRVEGNSFDISSTSGADAGAKVSWLLVNQIASP